MVIVPCFNEEERLPIKEFQFSSEKYNWMDFLFVDDGSRDATATILRSLAEQSPERFRFLPLSKNSGKAEAVRQGMLSGLSLQGYGYYGFLDADLSSPPEEFQFLMEFSDWRGGNHNFIFGSRLKILGANIFRNPMRHYSGRIAATAASVCLQLPVYDTQCGIKLFRKNVCQQIFNEPFISRWLFDVEIFFRLMINLEKSEFDRTVLEVPLRTWEEAPGTKLGFMDALRVPLELLRIRRKYSKLVRS